MHVLWTDAALVSIRYSRLEYREVAKGAQEERLGIRRRERHNDLGQRRELIEVRSPTVGIYCHKVPALRNEGDVVGDLHPLVHRREEPEMMRDGDPDFFFNRHEFR